MSAEHPITDWKDDYQLRFETNAEESYWAFYFDPPSNSTIRTRPKECSQYWSDVWTSSVIGHSFPCQFDYFEGF